MGERENKLSKENVLKTFSRSVKRAWRLLDGKDNNTFESLAEGFADLAKDLGATDFELADAYLAGVSVKNRQDLFEVYCEKIGQENQFTSLEDVRRWADDMVKIRDKYNLKDPLKQQEDEHKDGPTNFWPGNLNSN